MEERKISADASHRASAAQTCGGSRRHRVSCNPTRTFAWAAFSQVPNINITLQGETLEELQNWAPRIEARIRTLPGLRDVTSDQQDQGLQASLVFDRDTAARLGIQSQQIDETLYDAFGQRQVSTIYTQLNQYHVVMEVDPVYQNSPDAVQNLYVHSPTGAEVPLSAISHYEAKDDCPCGEPQRAIPGRHNFVQSGPVPGAWRCRQGNRSGHTSDGHAVDHSSDFFGNGAGVSGFAPE